MSAGSPASLSNGTTYQVMLRAVNAVGTGAASNQVLATPATTPDAPTGLNATTGASGAVNLTWTEPAHGGSLITDYVIEYSLAGMNSWTNAV